MCIFDFLKQNILFMAKFVKIIHLSLFGRQFFGLSLIPKFQPFLQSPSHTAFTLLIINALL